VRREAPSSSDVYEAGSLPEPDSGYSPIKRQLGPRELAKRLIAPVAVLLGLAIKFGAFTLKFFGIFLAVGGYALIWGWRFAVGFVALILVHELGHYVEARRQGLKPGLPVFIPFLGAYVAMKNVPFDPWRNALVSLAGPVAGGLGALAALALGESLDSDLLRALGYAGFFLNLINLLPVGFLDGGHVWRAFSVLRRGGGHPEPAVARAYGWAVGGLYAGLAAALVVGMLAAHVPQTRL
jgi:Zn-dependent protease